MSAYKSFAGARGLPIDSVLAAKNVNVILLSRPGSTKTAPSGVKVARVDYNDSAAVATIFKEHKVDFVFSTVGMEAFGVQKPLADAAKRTQKMWTGRNNGTEVFAGDILIDKGLIKGVGHFGSALLKKYGSDLVVIDAQNAWVTPGIVDIHSHMGNEPSPALEGASDGNSQKGTIQPWLRSLDALNTHDDSYALSIAGGVTTSLILPGSGDAIGGQAFVIKLRKTAERSSTSMVLEPPYTVNSSFPDPARIPRWRHMKSVFSEIALSVLISHADMLAARIQATGTVALGWIQYMLSVTRQSLSLFKQLSMTRVDCHRYNTASQIKKQQDEYCSKVQANEWDGLGEFPENLQWEALVDVVRGRVKVQIHCYEAVDFDGIVRLSNEFKFPVSAFHHAAEAYLVPDLIKKTYGPTPAIAMFATNARYKREAYRHSEFAPRILADNGMTVIMKSDHSVMNSRYLMYEAQQAYFYGLPENLAIASVISKPAEVMGMGHRIGYIKEGWDADLVIWDSHPLALGATPVQVFIDGIPQLEDVHVVQKPKAFQRAPSVPNFDKEAQEAVEYEGLPPLEPNTAKTRPVVFINVQSVFTPDAEGIQQAFLAADNSTLGTVVAEDGHITCIGVCSTDFVDATIIDLQAGSITPGLVSFGSPLGLNHIEGEPSTTDGPIYDPLSDAGVPEIVGGDGAIIRAADGLLFQTRDALLAYRAGVTSAIVAPAASVFPSGVFSGLGVSFSLGAAHKLEKGAVLQEVTGLHMAVAQALPGPSVSTQIAALRRLLLRPVEGPSKEWFLKVTSGEIPLVVFAHGADIIASLILLKKEVENAYGQTIQMTITGATEAHLLAKELGEAGVGVILNPARPFPYFWEMRRILPGPPTTEHTAVSALMAHNVTVGLGVMEIWEARNTRFEVAWASLASGGKMSRADVLALGSTNVAKLLGAKAPRILTQDLVATKGGDLLSFDSKVVAVISASRGLVDLL
ncbi:Carbohydrate esterase family 9 protein [Mycena venus]|uniref:Carbohydrate esterase family 9 protein n=1 Tax=Mycena venus TaxID=2733690 RepID=A0A8H7CAA8_9AGAR|nr:Carbohydrate esterase family 9 protein [Mycena venus]